MRDALKKNKSIWMCFLPFLAFDILQLIVVSTLGTPVRLFTAGRDINPNVVILLIVRVLAVLLFGMWYYYQFVSDGEQKVFTAIKNSLNVGAVRIVILIMAGLLMQIGLSIILTIILEQFPDYYAMYQELINGVVSVDVITVLYIAVISPITEEILFRGLIFGYMKRCTLTVVAIVMQAALFAVYHGNLVQGSYAFLIGILLGYLAYHFDSIIPAVILHFSLNLAGILEDRFMTGELPNKIGIPVMLVSLACASLLIYFILRKNTKKSDLNPS